MANYLGLDIGTSGCKAVVCDDQGRPLALARRTYELHLTADGGAELDSDHVIAQARAALAEARAAAGGELRALAVSSQGEAFTAVDSAGRSLCRAMVSSDTRAAGHARTWPEGFGVDRLYQITGHTAHPMFTLFKLLWQRASRPEVWDAAARFLCFEDLLHLRLGLEPAIGWPLAGRTMLFDVRRHGWSPEILDSLGLGAEHLARPLPSGSVVGRLPDGVLVVAGGHDQVCAALGAGATEPGVALYATGTVECITPAFPAPVFSEELRRHNLCTYDHAMPGRSATVAFSLTGGNILQWFRDEFAAGQEYETVLAELPADPSGLLALPYWTPSGTPYFDCDTPGAILGLRLSTRRPAILRALLEGVAFEMRLNLELLESSGGSIRELRAVGGGSRHPVWNQLKADVLNRPLIPTSAAEAGCVGAAMLACHADTGRPLDALAREWVKTGEPILPRSGAASAYHDDFGRYRRLRGAIRSVLR